jgi:hypothetical protein
MNAKEAKQLSEENLKGAVIAPFMVEIYKKLRWPRKRGNSLSQIHLVLVEARRQVGKPKRK